MSKLDNCIKITNENEDYAVGNLKYNGHQIPVVMDLNVYKIIQQMGKKWHVNDNGAVVTNHKIFENGQGITREIYLHDVVMKLSNENKYENILHINKIGVDVRKSNLMYDTCNKEILKNIKKKSRTITLRKDCGIDPADLPSFVWYLKDNDSHGERFIIDIGDIQWKSTSSKKVSLRYKLEETKNI
jgi:hypothetical protein